MRKISLIFRGETYPIKSELMSWRAKYRGITRDWYCDFKGNDDEAEMMIHFLKKVKRIGVIVEVVSDEAETDQEILKAIKK